MTEKQHKQWCKDLARLHQLQTENEQLKMALDYAKNFIDGYGAARVKENLGREGMDAVLKEIDKIAGEQSGNKLAKVLTNLLYALDSNNFIDADEEIQAQQRAEEEAEAALEGVK